MRWDKKVLKEEIYMDIPPGFSTAQTEGDDIDGIEDLKQKLTQEFEIKDLGQLRYFLGIEVSRSTKGLPQKQNLDQWHMEFVKYCG